jgi:hypothetical protein
LQGAGDCALTKKIKLRNKNITIESHGELLALYRLVVEGKFSANPHDRTVSASALVATVADKVLKKLLESSEQTGDNEEWLQFRPERREWKVALARAAATQLWPEWSTQEKERFAEILASPFRLTDDMRILFVAEADAWHRR